MKIGIVGLPNAGKSTIFNALAHTRVEVKKHPFTTIEPNVGMVQVPDPRLEKLRETFRPERVVPASIKFVDVAGLVEGASRGEGLGNQFLAAIRETAALAHVVRCFEAADVAHVLGEIDPARDIDVVRQELMLADLELVEKRIEKVARTQRSDPHRDEGEKELLEAIKVRLEKGADLKGSELTVQARSLLPGLSLLSLKPVIYVANMGEDAGQDNPCLINFRERAGREGAGLIELCGKLEEEIVGLPPDEQAAFREAMGGGEPGLEHLAKAARELLNLVTFFTKEGVEVRAWMVEAGTTARQAAGTIHSDMEKGFIKAEVVAFDDLTAAGNIAGVKERGHLRYEGRDYTVREGDVIRFYFK